MIMIFPSNFIIYDLEYTAWEGSLDRNWSGSGEYKEIIEIGAIAVNKSFKEVKSFSRLIAPTLNPVLSDYIINLTGITNKMISNQSVTFKKGYLDFLYFINKYAKIAFSYGNDRDVLMENIKMSGSNIDTKDTLFKNIRPYLEYKLNIPKNSVDSYLLNDYLNIESFNKAHRALGDCRCILNAITHIKNI